MGCVYGGDIKDKLKFIKKIATAAAERKIASIYLKEDPRQDLEVALQRYRNEKDEIQEPHYLDLGILYGFGLPEQEQKVGQLIIVKLQLPTCQQQMPVRPLLTEEEISNTHEEGSSSS